MTQEVLIVSDTESLVIESTDQEVFEIGIQGPPGPGTSIKTVNGTSVLGSGDITVSAVGHGHAISDVTGLQAAIDGKQATLVSGANIKTVNGTSLVGSGDVAITVSQSNLKSYFWAGA